MATDYLGPTLGNSSQPALIIHKIEETLTYLPYRVIMGVT